MIYKEELSTEGKFLALAVRGGRSQDELQQMRAYFDQLGVERCFDAARINKVSALVADVLDRELPGHLSDEWRQALESNSRRVSRLVHALRAVCSRLESIGATPAVVENGGIMLASNMPERAFCAGDFDLLVSPDAWPSVPECFAAEGFVAEDRRGRPTSRVEFAKERSGGEVLWLNAGCVPFDRMWVPLDYEDRTRIWLSRRQQSRKYADLHVLSTEDALAFVAMHTSLHSFIRAPGIRLHVDIDRLVRDNDVIWHAFETEVFAMRVPTRAFVSLSMAIGLLDSPVRIKSLAALDPGLIGRRVLLAVISNQSVMENGRSKLAGPLAVLLDAFLDERSTLRWLQSIGAPPEQWLLEHFGDPAVAHQSLVELQLTRWSTLLKRWRPR